MARPIPLDFADDDVVDGGPMSDPSTHLRALLATAERDLARHSHAERLTAAVVRRRDWRDRLLDDVLRGQESP